MKDLKCLDDIALGSSSNKYIKEEIKRKEEELKKYNYMLKLSVLAEDILKSIVDNSPEKSCNNWKRIDGTWTIDGYGNYIFYDWKMNTESAAINHIFELLDIDHEVSFRDLVNYGNGKRYAYKYKITIDEYELIKAYYAKLQDNHHKMIEGKLIRCEMESWPEWKKKYYDDNFAISKYAKKLCKDTN